MEKIKVKMLVRVKGTTTERGELLDFFKSTVNASRKEKQFSALPIGFFVKKLEGIVTKDLYALKSKMEDADRRGTPASAIFFLELRPNKEI